MRFYRVDRLISGKETGKLSKSSLCAKNVSGLNRRASVKVSGQQPNHYQAEHHHDHAEKSNLTFLQLEHLLKQA